MLSMASLSITNQRDLARDRRQHIVQQIHFGQAMLCDLLHEQCYQHALLFFRAQHGQRWLGLYSSILCFHGIL